MITGRPSGTLTWSHGHLQSPESMDALMKPSAMELPTVRLASCADIKNISFIYGILDSRSGRGGNVGAEDMGARYIDIH